MAKAGSPTGTGTTPDKRFPKVPADHPMFGGGFVFGVRRAAGVAPSRPISDTADLTFYRDGTIIASTPVGQEFLDENVGSDEFPNMGGGSVSVDMPEAEDLSEYAVRIGMAVAWSRQLSPSRRTSTNAPAAASPAPTKAMSRSKIDPSTGLPAEPKLADFPDEESFLEAKAGWQRSVMPILRLRGYRR
jgi:hypothetical protein